MKFIILGASGFVGKYTFDYIQSRGHDVVGTQSKAEKADLIKFNLLDDEISAGVERCLARLPDSQEPTFCVIFSFFSKIDDCLRQKEISHRVNVEKMTELINCLQQQKIRCVFISTSFVFDGTEGYYNEDDAPNPICEYGRHKNEVENYIKTNFQDVLIIRLDKVVGDNLPQKHLFSEWYRSFQEGRPIECIAGQLFSPTYGLDIARAVLLACQHNLSGLYHIANPEYFTREELARQFFRFLGIKADIRTRTQEEMGFIDLRPIKTYLDSTKFVEATGMTFTPMRKVFEIFHQKMKPSGVFAERDQKETAAFEDRSAVEIVSEQKHHTLIIGGTKGIGRTIAKIMAEQGHRVSVLGRSLPAQKIEHVQDGQGDLEHPDECITVIKSLLEKNGPLTSLIFSQRYRGEDSWDKEMAVDVAATKKIIDHLTSNGSVSTNLVNLKTITIISSIASQYIAEEQNIQYHVAKAALNQLVKYYAAALGPQGIRVNSVSPGTTIKEESKDFYAQHQELSELYQKITPLRRMGTAEDVAKVVAFLCSDEASFITGQNIIVDGGVSLQGHESLARRLCSLQNIPVAQPNRITGQKKCRLCRNEQMHLILNLASTPIGDAYLSSKQEFLCHPLDLYLCETCGLLQLPDFVDPELLYRDYIYHTSDSLGLVEHFRKYAESVLKIIDLPQNSLVLDIGSNDGSALQFYKNAGMRVLGIDPAREIAEHATKKGIPTLPEFFNTALAGKIVAEHGNASLIMANNVLANIDNLNDLMNGVKILLAPDGVIIFETGYALDLIQKRILDNIYHEHLSYFSVKPLQQFFAHNGLQLIYIERVPTKGGSIRCIVQRADGRRLEHPSVHELIALEEIMGIHKVSTLKQFFGQIREMKMQLTALLEDIKAQGKSIAGYGASVGVTTVLYALELGNLIDFLVDDNSNRQNCYSPGLQLPVKSPEAIYGVDYTLILAWQYAEPIIKKHQKYLEQGGKFIQFLPNLTIITK